MELEAVDGLVLIGQLHVDRLILAHALHLLPPTRASIRGIRTLERREWIEQDHGLCLQAGEPKGAGAQDADREMGLLRRLIGGGYEHIVTRLQVRMIANVPRVPIVRVQEAHVVLEEVLLQTLAEHVVAIPVVHGKGYQEPHEVTGSLKRSALRTTDSSNDTPTSGGSSSNYNSNQIGNSKSISRKTTLSRRISDASSQNGTSM